ncbi:MAG: hypothetical protein OXP66_14140 [Candidatus Tectomicrobia bacterium]|nr:hypothetical protein [Candidatus Tectomicrobia bacterium]
MAVSRKPANNPRQPADNRALQNYIRGGGSTARTEQSPAPHEIRQSVSIPSPVCQDLDTLRLSRVIKTSRSRWILEAVIEKIERDAPK